MTVAEMIFDIASAGAKLAKSPKVYPGYIAGRIKQALRQDDPQLARPNNHIIETVGAIETIGSCRYRLMLTDHNGTQYRVTVEVCEQITPGGAA